MMQKDLKIVAMIFHIILHPAELETEKTTGQTTDGGNEALWIRSVLLPRNLDFVYIRTL